MLAKTIGAPEERPIHQRMWLGREILFQQAKDWLTERGRKTAGSVEQGLEYARSAAEQAADKGAEYSRRLNPFHRELRRRFFGVL